MSFYSSKAIDMKQLYLLLFLILLLDSSHAQYSDYLGTGHSQGISVSSSDATANARASINGAGYDLDLQAASRFLAHATQGATIEEVKYLSEIGFENWIDEQFALPASNYTESTFELLFGLYEACLNNLGEQECNMRFIPNIQMFRFAWWHHTMRSPDKLRQRIALALSEILVISDNSMLINYPHAIAYYYDVLSNNAFGNYQDLLMDVSLNPAMGFYLSHINNPKTNAELNIHPDENYAREIMQLFTIGLYELNQDGSRKIDTQTGLWIPTYDNDDIKGLAKVFTGLSGSQWADDNDPRPVQFGRQPFRYSMIDPMRMYEFWHEPGPKTIVGDYVITGNSGMEDIELAIEHIFNHANVAPFIAYRLIQRLVKSNPSPEYIERVALAFNDNDSGVRGDMKAVIKAILLDEEAMACYWYGHEENGQLRPPIHRFTQMLTAMKAETESEEFWNSGFFFQELTGQHPMSSPTVFNFYRPDYVPDSDFALYDLVGPEYQILNSSTSSNYVNFMLLALMGDYFESRYGIRLPELLNEPFLIPYIDNPEHYEASLEDPLWQELGFHPEHLVDYLDLVLANGQLSDDTRNSIIESIRADNIFNSFEKASYALFMVMINPDYVIMK